MSSQNELEIPFEGLKVGKHTFQFDLTDAFFDDIAHSIIEKGSVHVEILLDKKENIMTADFEVDGEIQALCDRCNDLAVHPLHFEHRLVFKFGEEASEDEDLIIIPPNEYKIKLSPILHELLTVEVPPRLVHEESECNEEMLDLLDEYAQSSQTTSTDDEDDIDPRWDALKGLNK
ncbi:MAG: YceD family protein [Bacteroidota bacterium]